MWHMKGNGQRYLFLKGSLLIEVPVKTLKAIEAGEKTPFFKYISTIFFFVHNLFFEILFYHNTIPVGNY